MRLLPPTVATLFLLLGCDKDVPETRSSQTEGTPTPTAVTQTAAPTAMPSATAPSEPARPQIPKDLNVMLLTIDSLRADAPWTTYSRKTAPNLTKLAQRSVVYPNHYAVSSGTPKSVPAMLAGRYPSSVYRSGWFFAGFSDANLFFTEILQDAGVRTMGGQAHKYFDRGKNIEQGFDIWRIVDGISFDSTTDRSVTSDKMTDMAIEMLSDKANTSKQFFMWFHYMDPHDQYIKHEMSPDFGKTNRDRYDSEVFFTDHHIGRLMDFAKEKDWWERTAIIISADHGEAFGEHGMYKHAFELWEVLTRVPLVVYYPGVEPRTIEQRRSQIDLGPTILEMMGHPIPDSFVGKSLVPELTGAEPDNREPIVLDLPEDKNSPQRRAIISDDYKLIVKNHGAQHLLFNLKEDPEEKNNLAKKEPEKLQEMKTLFEATWEDIDEVLPYGGMKMANGTVASGSEGPVEEAKTKSATDKKNKSGTDKKKQ